MPYCGIGCRRASRFCLEIVQDIQVSGGDWCANASIGSLEKAQFFRAVLNLVVVFGVTTRRLQRERLCAPSCATFPPYLVLKTFQKRNVY
ncbi:hypothetical protein SAMN06265373_101326 [Shimia sagamensis]|uniref:Uncharacterized protein n=1 Tax=Shimia sagamensis TaxID=1566352 RepID=A0ABY1N8D2_9RHOB|nr:hypothetical protein SAMN06265373_101326 [Shimia sagamensis]